MALLTNDIYVGSVSDPLYHFTNADAELGGFKGSFALDVIGNELSIDTFTVTIRMTEDDLYDALYDSLDSPLTDSTDDALFALTYGGVTTLRDFLQAIPYGTPVWWYVDGVFYVKGYCKSIDRVSKYGFKITCTSGVGLLDTPMHAGGMYRGVPITTVLASIIGGAFTYTVSAAVQASLVYGHLKYKTCRENLHELLFAVGAGLHKGTPSTDYRIEFLDDAVAKTATPGAVVSVDDGAAMPVQALTIDIDAVQSGSGDPSPTNIRPISGWDKAKIWVQPTHDTTANPTVTIDLDGTRYGGTLNVTTGVLTVTHALTHETNNNGWVLVSGTTHHDYKMFYKTFDNLKITATNTTDIVSDRLKTGGRKQGAAAFADAYGGTGIAYVGASSGGYRRMYITIPGITTKPQLDTFFESNTLDILYPLSVKQTVQLTPTEVTTLLGQNNVWADTGNITSLTYMAKTPIENIPSSRIALQGSVDYQLPSNRVEITEHAFFESASQPTETLFDNTSEAAVDGLLVLFDKPVVVSTLATTGTLTVSSSGVNFAVVSGVGTLTGKYYVHTTQVDVLENNPRNEPLRVRRVTENELISALNVRNVARRVLSYYQSAKQVKARIICDNEKCGQLYQFTDSFGDTTKGYMAKMDTLITSVKGANCVLVDGFEAGSGGNNYLHRQEITASGTWTVPLDIPIVQDGKGYVRFVVVQGGTGGTGGYDGADGLGGDSMIHGDPQWGAYSEGWGYYQGINVPQTGGDAGTAGTQGKVYIIDKLVAPGEVVTWNIGAAGVGGARNGGAGTAGGHTTATSVNIGTVTSADGQVINGYVDPMTGDVFATAGLDGIKGGDGAAVDSVGSNAFEGDGLAGQSAGGIHGGIGGHGASIVDSAMPQYHAESAGGAGGGAAYGAVGGDGADAIATIYPSAYQAIGGNGGHGADALAPSKPTFGNGGAAGNGGGAGGNAGGAIAWSEQYEYSPFSVSPGAAGVGGHGSVGGNGGDGLGIVYW